MQYEREQKPFLFSMKSRLNTLERFDKEEINKLFN